MIKSQSTKKDFDKKIIEAIKKGFSVVAWNTFDGVVEKCDLKLKALRKDYSEIELECLPENIEKLKSIVSGNIMIKIFIPELSISFKTKIKMTANLGKIKIAIPEEFSFYERRQHIRVNPERSSFAYLNHAGNANKSNIYDISLGGFSVILAKSNKISIEKNKVFKNTEIEVYGHRIVADIECTNSVTLDNYKVESLPYGGFKVSFRFLSMSKQDKDYLTDYITNQILSDEQFKKAN